MLIIGIGLIVGVTLFLLLSFVLWKVGLQYFSVVLKSGIHTVGGSWYLLVQVKGEIVFCYDLSFLKKHKPSSNLCFFKTPPFSFILAFVYSTSSVIQHHKPLPTLYMASHVCKLLT